MFTCEQKVGLNKHNKSDLLILHYLHRIPSKNLDIITSTADMEAADVTSFLCSPEALTMAGMMNVYIFIHWDLGQAV